ncbi:phospholipid carrier-dependent glycosyltransferase [Sphingomonas sp.]|uniref:phospholipid carrier-dependent glycosyltransferase n=1 Tax=Sphingomonas sp. TaxID=28214 RepID=UPI003B008BBB
MADPTRSTPAPGLADPARAPSSAPTYREDREVPRDTVAVWRARATHPVGAAILLAVVAQLLFTWHLATPHTLVFDEIHYVPAARRLWALTGPANIEHPLLGKALIGIGIALFGDDSFGWRIMATLAGTATMVGLYAIAWLTFRDVRTAVVTGLLAILNFTLYVQARIAMLDGFMAALVVVGAAAMLWSMRSEGAAVGRRWLLGSVLLGLAAGVKWVAVPYGVLAAVAYLLARGPTRWPGLTIWDAAWRLALGSGIAYFATFLPAFFYASEPLTLATLLPFQLTMFTQQTQVLPHHTYQSAWWSWPLLIRPIWYLYEPVDGAQRGILLLGNPAIMWGGLIAVAACLWGWLRERSVALGGVAALWLGGWGMWALIPKSLGFYYYYYLPSLWLPLAIAAAFHRFGQGRARHWDESFVVLSAGLFLYFWPIISAAPLYGPQAFQHWMWFGSWL